MPSVLVWIYSVSELVSLMVLQRVLIATDGASANI